MFYSALVNLPYNIPGNAMACAELTHTASMLIALLSADPNDSKMNFNTNVPQVQSLFPPFIGTSTAMIYALYNTYKR